MFQEISSVQMALLCWKHSSSSMEFSQFQGKLLLKEEQQNQGQLHSTQLGPLVLMLVLLPCLPGAIPAADLSMHVHSAFRT